MWITFTLLLSFFIDGIPEDVIKALDKVEHSSKWVITNLSNLKSIF